MSEEFKIKLDELFIYIKDNTKDETLKDDIQKQYDSLIIDTYLKLTVISDGIVTYIIPR